MSMVLTQEMPGMTRELVEAVSAELHLDTDPAPGLIFHTAVEIEGGIRIVDVWENAADFATFNKTRLGPAIGKVAQAAGLDVSAIPEMAPTAEAAFDLLLP